MNCNKVCGNRKKKLDLKIGENVGLVNLNMQNRNYEKTAKFIFKNILVCIYTQLDVCLRFSGMLSKLKLKSNKDDNIHKQGSSKKSDLYLSQGPRKSPFPLNPTDRQTYGRMDISIYRVASLLKMFNIRTNHTISYCLV